MPVSRESTLISMLKDPTAAVLVSKTVSLAGTPWRRFTQGKGRPAWTKHISEDSVLQPFFQQLKQSFHSLVSCYAMGRL